MSFQSAFAPIFKKSNPTTSATFIKTFGNVEQGLTFDFPLV